MEQLLLYSVDVILNAENEFHMHKYFGKTVIDITKLKFNIFNDQIVNNSPINILPGFDWNNIILAGGSVVKLMI